MRLFLQLYVLHDQLVLVHLLGSVELCLGLIDQLLHLLFVVVHVSAIRVHFLLRVQFSENITDLGILRCCG